MKEKIMAVCDLEEAYAFRMAEFIVQKGSIPYKLHLFTGTEALELFMEKNEISVLLIGEGAMGKLKKEPGIPNVFVLWEGGEKRNTAYRYIDKYQKPEAIFREAAEHIAEMKGWEEARERGVSKLKVIGIYSPVRRCLQTSFALTMGQLLAREHKTLYLNFECYSGFDRMLQREFQADMLDVLYYFKCAREKLSLRLPSMVQSINGLDFIPPGKSGLDMQGITGEQWLELLRMIEGVGGYEYLILDLTDGMNGLFSLLSRCYRIYTITKDDGFAMAKISQYEQILRMNELDEIADKTVKCRFPLFEKLPSDLNLMTHGELAGYVKAIIREDLHEKQAG
ncbi:MAG: hypothetical protein NC341_12380 [Blautia sp.]|nr:hypothetical protein [Blautia sp.]MCM1199912.1 hypothetical protein [Bacteroides fragilis]